MIDNNTIKLLKKLLNETYIFVNILWQKANDASPIKKHTVAKVNSHVYVIDNS